MRNNTFTGKHLRARLVSSLAKRASKYLPMIQIVKGDPPNIVKIPSLYSDTRMGFGCKLEKSR
jgi:hypothetical protein